MHVIANANLSTVEVWLDGTQRITYDDSPGFASGSVGMVNYDANVKYDNFNVYQQ